MIGWSRVRDVLGRRGVMLTLTRVAIVTLLVPAVLQLQVLARVLARRLAFPMDLEWMESGHLYHAYRLSHQLPIYVDPARGFAAFPYPPLYWIVVGALGRLVGLDYWTGRFVSIASIVGIAVVFGVLLVRRAPTRWLGLAFAMFAAASTSAGYPLVEASLDLARTDAFATFVPVVAAALIGEARLSSGRVLVVALALTASIYAKQTGVFFVVWLLVFVVVRDRRRGLLLGMVTGALSLLLLGIMHVATDGWFLVWILDMRHHAIVLGTFFEPIGVFVRHAPFLVVVPPVAIALVRRGWLRPETVKWLGMLGAAIAGAMLAHVKAGGWFNLYIPVVLLAWPVSFLLVGDLLRGLGPSRVRTRVVTWGVLFGASGILLALRYDPTRYEPTPAMWRGAEHLHEVVSSLDGCVVVTTVPFAATRSGKQCTQPIQQAYFDGANAGMKVSFVDALDRSGAAWVIVTGTWLEARTSAELETKFELVRTLDLAIDTPGVHHPFPRTLWRRREPTYGP